MAEVLKNSETLPENLHDWMGLVDRVLSVSERPNEHSAHFRNSEGTFVSVTFFEGRPIKLSLISAFGNASSKRTVVFFDLEGKAESIRSVEHAAEGFTNGVRRGPARRSVVSELAFRQDFAIDGTAKAITEIAQDATAELHIHTRSFVGGASSESANSFLGYALDESGVRKSGNRVADKASHFPGTDRIFILETRVRTVGESDVDGTERSRSERVVGHGYPEHPDTHNTEITPAETQASEGRLPYRVEMSDSRIEVRMGDRFIGGFEVRDRFGFEEIEATLFPNEGSSRMVDVVVRTVENALSAE